MQWSEWRGNLEIMVEESLTPSAQGTAALKLSNSTASCISKKAEYRASERPYLGEELVKGRVLWREPSAPTRCIVLGASMLLEVLFSRSL